MLVAFLSYNVAGGENGQPTLRTMKINYFLDLMQVLSVGS